LRDVVVLILKHLSTYPLIFLTIGLILGILGYQILSLPVYFSIVGFILSCFIALFFHFKQNQAVKKAFYYPLSVFMAVLFLGQLLAYKADARHFKKFYAHFIKEQNEQILKIKIIKTLKPTKRYAHYVGQVEAINKHRSFGKILLKAPKQIEKLLPGQKLSILADSVALQPIPKALNPFGFDYSKFMKRRNIFYQINLKETAFSTDGISGFNFINIAGQTRQKIKTYFKENGLKNPAYSLAITLLLGERQNLSKDVYRAFQTAGTVHILAISGLHIGILLMFLNFLFKPLKRYSKLLFLILTLSFLWLYAFLTGFSPSVLRAVIMFSFLQIGLQSKRQVYIYNSLFTAALLMLLINPNNIYQVGFQMSFMAVLAIVSFFPVFSSWVKVKNKVLKWWLDLFWISLAAQLGVLPLSLFYFHQFPVYFFIANLFVIPLLFPVLFLGFILVGLSFTGLHLPLLFQAFQSLLDILLNINRFIAGLPNALITNIPFHAYLLVLGFLGLILLYPWLKQPKSFQNTIVFLSWILLFQIGIFYQKFFENKADRYYIFHQYKTPVTARNFEKELVIYQDSSLVNPYLLKSLQTSFQRINFKKLPVIDSFKKLKILHIDSLGIYNFRDFKPDIIALHYSPKINLERLIIDFHPKTIVVDGSSYPSFILRWQQSAQKYQIKFYDVNRQGAFVLK